MSTPAEKTVRPLRPLERALPWLGVVLLVQFGVMSSIKVSKGLGADILWMSHMGLVIGGLGLILRRQWLIAATIIGVTAIHAMWVADLLAWAFTGSFPLSMTEYMATAPTSTWISTSHHFYLVPALLLGFILARRFQWSALGLAILMFAILSIISRLGTPIDRNVNCAFSVEPGPDVWLVRWLNEMDGAVYLLALNALVAVILFLPVACALAAVSAALERRRSRLL